MLSSVTSAPLTDSRIGLEGAVLDAYGLPVVVTHLTSGAAASNTRAQQIDRLTAWARGFGEPRLVIGDFNAAPQAAELQLMIASYHDAWTDAMQMGRATGSSAQRHGAR